ncbi:MAG: M48 family metallopeptidase [Chloroflexota bacterium]|nr:M48 family metallopeptidase [Chloroflexota bacterium]
MNSKPELLTIDGHTIRVYRQRRRSLVMKTTPLGLVLFIPKRVSLRSDMARDFIADALGKLAHKSVDPDLPIVSTPAELRAMVDVWAGRMGVQPTRVSVREMFRKWGSCSSKGSISLNTALCRVPRELAEYVVVHELVHLLEFNHGKGFKALMDRHLPDWRLHEQQLQTWMEGGTLD